MKPELTREAVAGMQCHHEWQPSQLRDEPHTQFCRLCPATCERDPKTRMIVLYDRDPGLEVKKAS
jgi:hypothetical protein